MLYLIGGGAIRLYSVGCPPIWLKGPCLYIDLGPRLVCVYGFGQGSPKGDTPAQLYSWLSGVPYALHQRRSLLPIDLV